MRFVAALVAGLALCVSLTVILATSSVLGVTESADALLDVARGAQARDVLVDLTTDYIDGEIRSDPTLVPIERAQLRAMVDEVMGEDWFESSVASAHRATRQAVEEAARTAVLDLRNTKTELRTSIDSLAERATRQCDDVFGADACAQATNIEQLARDYRVGAHGAIDRIADRLDLVAEPGGRTVEPQDIRAGIGWLETARWIALGVFVAATLLLAALYRHPLERLFLAVGIALSLSAGLYLFGVDVAASVARSRAETALAAEHEAAGLKAGDESALQRGQQLALDLGQASAHRAMLPASLIGSGGVVLIVIGLFLRHRRRAQGVEAVRRR